MSICFFLQYWKDKKGTVKRKVVLFNANKHDPCCEKDYMTCLNKFEQRIMRLIEECSDTSHLHMPESEKVCCMYDCH